MNDKTAIEKAREALVSVSRIVDVLSLFDVGGATEGSIAYKVKEALAAIDAEKPAEEACSLVYQWQIDCKRDCELESRSELASRIGRFAESYHAAQCVKCKEQQRKELAELISVCKMLLYSWDSFDGPEKFVDNDHPHYVPSARMVDTGHIANIRSIINRYMRESK